MLKACTVCGAPSDQARCPEHRYTRDRSRKARAQRMRVIERDGFLCQRCGKRLSGGRDTHVDHIVRLADGGSEHDSNKQALCSSCNQQKG